jgi:Ethanolamine utilization protein EutJ (predicted chaperonin)
MCKKNKAAAQSTAILDDSFRVDMDALEEQLYGLKSEDWEAIKPILIKMEDIKLKYVGEYDYGESF